MNNPAGHQMDLEWHLSQPRLGLPTEEPGLGVTRHDINGSGLLSDAHDKRCTAICYQSHAGAVFAMSQLNTLRSR